jgi:alkylated DNA repair dioxygenase AlkB
LIGGQTRDTAPHAVLLQSGDVMVMTGSGRGAYHGKEWSNSIALIVLLLLLIIFTQRRSKNFGIWTSVPATRH